MAVHLKKRACEEFSQVIQETKPQVKKLRLSKPSTSVSQSFKLEDFKLRLDGSSHEVLQSLMQFSKRLPVPPEYVQEFIEALLKHFKVEKDSAVRVKIVWVLDQLCSTLGFYPVRAIDDIITLLNTEVSGKVLAQLWTTILSVAQKLPAEKALHQNLVDLACSALSDHHQEVRCKCLSVIGSLGSNKNSSKLGLNKKWDTVNVHTLVADYFADPEPRVRCNSLKALIRMHQRGQRLDLIVYEQACSALHDDYSQVRFIAVELVWILSHIYPESLVKAPYSDEKLRLADDAFAKICNLFNDSSYKVRAEAARLLGSIHLVSDNFLFQTLDKKLMSDLRKKKSLNEQAKEGFVEEFSTGTKWADDAPKTDFNADATMLMNSGACGAFVHGLEDEMMEVRMAAVDSLTELAAQRSNPSFAQQALDFLVDCLNDEIEAVRLNAVNSLHKIVEHVTLLEDQLDNVHSAMEDAGKEIREGIHQLLSSCSLMSKACLYDTIMMLLKNLNKYPQDRQSIWKTQQALGRHHSNLVYLLVPQLLSCHPFFDTSEPQMDDPCYIAVLILVFNAAVTCPQSIQLFPEHVTRHYHYLRDSIPDLVPQQIKLTSFTSGVGSLIKSPARPGTSADPTQFLVNTMSRVKNLQAHQPETQRTILECTIRDLRHTALISPNLSSTAQCSADFLQAQLLLSKVVDKKGWSGSTYICAQHLAFAKPAALQIIQLTYELEHLYIGLSSNEIGLVRQLRLKAQALLFVIEMQEANQTANKSQLPKSKRTNYLCDEFFANVKEAQTYINARNISPDSFTKTLFNELLKLSSSKKPSLIVKLLQPLLSHYSVSEVDLNNMVQRSNVEVHEPRSRLDSVITFSAGLAACLNVEVTSENIMDPLNEIRIQVTYPDSTNHIFQLLTNDVKQITSFKHQINSRVYLSHQQWSDSCVVKIQFLKIFSRGNFENSTKDHTGLLPLCKPVEVALQPKPTSRI